MSYVSKYLQGQTAQGSNVYYFGVFLNGSCVGHISYARDTERWLRPYAMVGEVSADVINAISDYVKTYEEGLNHSIDGWYDFEAKDKTDLDSVIEKLQSVGFQVANFS